MKPEAPGQAFSELLDAALVLATLARPSPYPPGFLQMRSHFFILSVTSAPVVPVWSDMDLIRLLSIFVFLSITISICHLDDM